MTKTKTSIDEKLEKQDVDLFELLAAIDRKDYSYYDTLTDEQKYKLGYTTYMIIKWLPCVKGKIELQQFYTLAVNEFANKHFHNEVVTKHSKLRWLMLCASSPGVGKTFRQWLPQISERITLLKDQADKASIKQFYTKTYPQSDKELIDEISELYVKQHKKKMYLAKLYPQMNIDEIEVLSQLVTESDIENYDKESGN